MKNKYLFHLYLLFTACILIMMFAVAYDSLTNRTIATEQRSREELPLTRYDLWKSRMVIVEKEVIVYVNKEPEPEPVQEIIEEEVVTYPEQNLDSSFDIMIPSGLTRDELYRSLGGTRNGIVSSIDAIYDAEQIYGVNALYLLATLGLESGWGQYESGVNNIAGWKMNDGSWMNFDSRYDCIMTVANGLANDFSVTVGSDLYNVTTRYTPDVGYMDTILGIMAELKSNI